MIIKNALLNIIDLNSNIVLNSNNNLNLNDEKLSNYVISHITKCFNSMRSKNAVFNEESKILKLIKNYSENGKFESFLEISSYLSDKYLQCLSESCEEGTKDLLFIDFEEEGIKYLAFMLLNNKSAFTHIVNSTDNGMSNQIIEHQAILPNVSSKSESYAIIKLDDLSILFEDSKKLINETNVFILKERILECDSKSSTKEIVDTIKKVTEEISEEFGLNKTLNLSKAKSLINDSFKENIVKVKDEETDEIIEKVEISNFSDVNAVELGNDIFNGNEYIKEKFTKRLEELNIPKEVKIEKKILPEINKKQRIKTDNGIELSIPTQYLNDSNFVEFINNPDGTISIKLKNIGKIINRN